MPPQKKKGFKNLSDEFPDIGSSNPSSSSKGKGKKPVGASSPADKTAKDTLLSEPVYFRKESLEKILSIPLEDYQQGNSPWAIKERFLDKQNFPIHHGLFRYIYESILIETLSVQIKHFHKIGRAHV